MLSNIEYEASVIRRKMKWTPSLHLRSYRQAYGTCRQRDYDTANPGSLP